MANPKGNPNITEYGHETRFGAPGRGCSAAEDGRKGNDSQAFTRALMSEVSKKVDLEKASKELASLIENGNLKALSLWFEYNASKPATKIEAEVEDRTLNVIINDGSDN